MQRSPLSEHQNVRKVSCVFNIFTNIFQALATQNLMNTGKKGTSQREANGFKSIEKGIFEAKKDF